MIRKDLLDHFIYWSFGTLVIGHFLPLWLSILIMGVAGIGKEIYDRYVGGCPDILDFAFDCLGIAFATIILVIT